ncbi:MAG: hypothetical protein EOO01_26760 [Chitinophagaceae bacterium]|nr:MAG: hypothetical protein EOO01_26760 [Chitinophagaceae bacterium]
MILHLTPFKLIHEVQEEFNTIFPFLRLDFYRMQENEARVPVKKLLGKTVSLRTAGLEKEGILHVHEGMTVAELETAFRKKFQLLLQVSRQSGNVWLETTMTDDWSLQQQNEHGAEITIGTGNRNNK